MKYTVVIRQAVPEGVRVTLEQQLMARFALSGEQAQRLSSRTTGRLMKPTGRARAELLLSVFRDVGVQVELEEVREETGLLSEPFQAIGMAGTAAALPAKPAAEGHDEAPLASLRPLGDASHDRTVPDGAAQWPDATPVGAPTSFTSLPSSSLASSPPALSSLPSSEARTGETLVPDAAAWQPPAKSDWAETDWSGWGGTPTGGRGENDPFQAEFTPAVAPASLTPKNNPLTAPLTFAADPTVSISPAPTLLEEAPDNGPSSGDVWSDFTGALIAPDLNGPDIQGTDTRDPKLTDAGAAQNVLFNPEVAPKVQTPRRSLIQQLTFSTLVPLALSTGLTLGLLGLLLPSMQGRLVQQNAQAVAVAVGTGLNVTNEASVNAQLDALLGNSSVGFVRVELPDGTGYFRSRYPDADSKLQPLLAAKIAKNPDSASIRFDLSPTDTYREQLRELEDLGAGKTPQAEKLRKAIADPKNAVVDRATYVLSRLGVSQDAQGRRVASSENQSQNLLYRVTVGVSNAEAGTNLRNTLLLVLGVSLLALGLGALLARRAAQRMAAPIERLVKVADAISMGDLSRPVKAEANDEIGDLAQALERMRQSLEAAMERLRRRKRG